MPKDNQLEAKILKLLAYCQANDWAGYDPYDAAKQPHFCRSAIPQLKTSSACFDSGFEAKGSKFVLLQKQAAPSPASLRSGTAMPCFINTAAPTQVLTIWVPCRCCFGRQFRMRRRTESSGLTLAAQMATTRAGCLQRPLGSQRKELNHWRLPSQSASGHGQWKFKVGGSIFARMPDLFLAASGRMLYRHLG